MLKKYFSSGMVICVFAWLLPLGAFIKVGQEQTACGGKRAFHMCSCLGKINFNGSAKPGISASSGFNENAKSSASGGDDLLLSSSQILFARRILKHSELSMIFCPQTVSINIFHPPRALSLI